MGNLSSCTTAFMLSSQHLPHMVRVLLVDGSVLKLRAPISVSKLLAEYPNHVICSLSSLKPGLHALSSLSPNEELQLGGLYLLLPLRSHAQRARIARKSEIPIRERALNERISQDKVGSRAPPTKKSGVGISSRAESSRNGHVGSEVSSSDSKLSRKCEVGTLEKNELQRSHGSCSRSTAAKALRRRRQGERLEKEQRQCIMNNKNRRGINSLHSRQQNNSVMVDAKLCSVRRLCNTPELQRAYLSLLRRWSTPSWTPKLQPINERR
ncbi:hypothetical protein L7F22_009778 [Adiantum nelumboides]|nr:hypothetical protein [Adiantum nelumboides]